eukprot:9125672-Heterocapsa_arctica.AAC.1
MGIGVKGQGLRGFGPDYETRAFEAQTWPLKLRLCAKFEFRKSKCPFPAKIFQGLRPKGQRPCEGNWV